MIPREGDKRTRRAARIGNRGPTLSLRAIVVPSALMAAGILLYASSLTWPLLSSNPQWMAYIPAFGGTAAMLLALRKTRTKGHPTARRF